MINWQEERKLIAACAAACRVDPDLIESIRLAVDGVPGRQFGDLGMADKSFEAQLLAACRLVGYMLADYEFNPLMLQRGKLRYNRSFVRWLSGHWQAGPRLPNQPAVDLVWFTAVWGAYNQRIEAR